ncbi:AraC-type DNA-binding protein [Marinobacterium lutimaris]|uniref:AraC-type DNA-binding protein n=2 Tax=Marinobacterium lutimaris TaxID=568106 RepID=A0A1H5WJK0_9GAMM|nr:AraC-type DNA-binding protein [Marinobacterium lutimaris]
MTLFLSLFDQEIKDVSALEIYNFLRNNKFSDYRLIRSDSVSSGSSVRYKDLGPLQIAEYTNGCATEERILILKEAYHLQLILGGQSSVIFDGETIELGPGDSVMLSSGTKYMQTYSPGSNHLSVRIPLDFLHQSAREFGYFPAGAPIRFVPYCVNVLKQGAIRHILRDILELKASATSERAQLYYAKLLCHGILQSHQSDICLNNRVTRSEHRHIAQVRGYVLDNITDDINIQALASLCRISRKSLYNLFERETGLTPSLYIRQLKLEIIYAELSGDLDNIRNVTEVAMKYGFTNLGRFSAQYRDHIGELPSETLRRQSH